MGLVDYSESDGSASESEAPVKATQLKAPASKKAFQKVVDRSKPGKIVVNLPDTKPDAPSDEPPAKRVRTGATGGGRFSGFNSFLPAPKKQSAVASAPKSSSGTDAKPRPGINLRTSAAPGFSRDTDGADQDANDTPAGGMGLPAPKKQAEPTVPEGQKSAEEVKLVGKPMMFKPLSVARNPNKKKTNKPPGPKPATSAAANTSVQGGSAHTDGIATAAAAAAPPPPPKKASLFSMHTEEPAAPSAGSGSNSAYEPLFQQETETNAHDEPAQYAAPAAAAAPAANDVDAIADDLQLDAAARRELFGRGGRGGQAAKNVINFNMDKEYQHNEALRASGEQQIHNPVRAIQGGKGSLKSLISNVQNQRDALEDSFAQGKHNRKEASSRYGW